MLQRGAVAKCQSGITCRTSDDFPHETRRERWSHGPLLGGGCLGGEGGRETETKDV